MQTVTIKVKEIKVIQPILEWLKSSMESNVEWHKWLLEVLEERKFSFIERYITKRKEYDNTMDNIERLEDYIESSETHLDIRDAAEAHINDIHHWKNKNPVQLKLMFVPFLLQSIGTEFWYIGKDTEEKQAMVDSMDNKDPKYNTLVNTIAQQKNKSAKIREVYDSITKKALEYKEELEWYQDIQNVKKLLLNSLKEKTSE